MATAPLPRDRTKAATHAAIAAFNDAAARPSLDAGSREEARFVERCRHPLASLMGAIFPLYVSRSFLLSNPWFQRQPFGGRLGAALLPLAGWALYKLATPTPFNCYLNALASDTPIGLSMRKSFAAHAPDHAWLAAAEAVAASQEGKPGTPLAERASALSRHLTGAAKGAAGAAEGGGGGGFPAFKATPVLPRAPLLPAPGANSDGWGGDAAWADDTGRGGGDGGEWGGGWGGGEEEAAPVEPPAPPPSARGRNSGAAGAPPRATKQVPPRDSPRGGSGSAGSSRGGSSSNSGGEDALSDLFGGGGGREEEDLGYREDPPPPRRAPPPRTSYEARRQRRDALRGEGGTEEGEGGRWGEEERELETESRRGPRRY